jgi:hypothetical protein
MILANHPCPNCKAILECSGVAEGELIDCPQCGKPFEAPFMKRVSPPALAPAAVNTKKGIPAILWIVIVCSAGFVLSLICQNVATEKTEVYKPDITKCFRMHGKVMQIVNRGILLSNAKITEHAVSDSASNDDNDFLPAAPDHQPVFVSGASAYVDGESWSGVVIYGSPMQYKTVLGANKNVNGYIEVKLPADGSSN